MNVAGTRFREACILIAPVEATSSFLRGSLLGPEAVAREIASLDLFDPELGRRLDSDVVLHEVVIAESERGLPSAISAIENVAERQLEMGRFVLMLGGEHTVTLGTIRAMKRQIGDIGLIQFDAHGDLRDRYEGRKISHACVMRRAVDDLDMPLLGFGIRSVCQEEIAVLEHNDSVTHINARKAAFDEVRVEEAIDAMPDLVYLTIDMDVFDPSVAPGVGTPEAGGMTWHQVSRIIDVVASKKRIIGADVVELAPTIERERTVRLAARIAIRVLLQSLGVDEKHLSSSVAVGEANV